MQTTNKKQTAKQAEREIVSHFSERPCAAEGLISYRAKGNYGYIMIGARSDVDAMREAFRSSPAARELEVWNGERYVAVELKRER